MLRVSQWAEIRHMHEVQHVPKREISRRLILDIKTVRRELARSKASHKRASPRCVRKLDPLRARVVDLLKGDPELTAKRIGRLREARMVRHRGLTGEVHRLPCAG